MRPCRARARLGRMSAVESYVAALDRALVGPARVRRGLVREAHDHLDDGAAAYARAGYGPGPAERLAVTDFGRLDDIVPAFQTTLAVAAARRTSGLLLAILAIQPFLWDGALAGGLGGGVGGGVAPDGLVYAVLDTAVEVVGGAMILAALALVVATGVGSRWRPAGPAIARVTSFVAIGAAGSTTTIGVAMTVLSSGSDVLAWLLLSAFIIVPMTAAATSARRTLATC